MTTDKELLAMCENLMERMDRARGWFHGPSANFGVLDTTIDRVRLTELKRRLTEPSDEIICPFCGEAGYDRDGLYRHLIAGTPVFGSKCEALAAYEKDVR